MIRGSIGASTGTIINNGSISMLGTGGRAIYVFTNGDVSVTNGASGSLSGTSTFGIFAQDAGTNHSVTVINDGNINLTAASSTGIRAVATGTSGSVSVIQNGTVSAGANGIGVELYLGTTPASTGLFQNSGSISGGTGVDFSLGFGSVTATNTGSIIGTGTSLASGGLLVNNGIAANITNSGLISGNTGVILNSNNNSLTNTGTITGTNGTAISVTGTNNTVTLDDGSIINGTIVSTGAANTILLQGSGALSSDLSGFSTLTMSGNLWELNGNVSTTTGLTTITAGTLQIGTGGTTGNITDDIINNGILAFNRSDDINYAGIISGSGELTQIGAGTTTLTGINTYSGETNITAGTLAAGGVNVFSPNSSYTIEANGTMALNGFSHRLNDITNAGEIRISGANDARLTVSNYVGNGGTIALNTYLGTDNSPSDRLVIDGGTATGSTTLAITNNGGIGALTTANGIQVVETINGATTSATAFRLNAPLVAGAFEYSLHHGGIGADANNQNWYLRSIDTTSAGGPNGEALSTSAQTSRVHAEQLRNYALSTLSTLQQRTGNRNWTSDITINNNNHGDDSSTYTESINGTGVWGRVAGQYSSYDPKNGSPYTQKIGFIQTGYESIAFQNSDGILNTGLYATIGTSHADIKLTIDPVTALRRNSKITTTGYGIGANATWLSNNGFYADAVGQLTWYDGKLPNKISSNNAGWSSVLSLEIGQNYEIDADWTIVPQAQLAWTHVDFNEFTDIYGARASLADGDSLKGRVGIQMQTPTNWQGNNNQSHHLQLYGIANLSYEFLSNNKVDVANIRLEQNTPRLWGEFGFGGNYMWGRYWSTYGEVSYATALSSRGGDENYTLKGTIGLRYRW